MFRPELENMQNIEVRIVKAAESSGNLQYFVRAVRTDSEPSQFLEAMLEYQCFQTKYLDRDECIKRAMFSSTFLLRFFGKTASDLKVINFDGYDDTVMEEDKRFWRTA